MQALGPIKGRLNIVRTGSDDRKEDPHLHPARASPKHSSFIARPASPQKRAAPLVANRVDLEAHEVGRGARTAVQAWREGCCNCRVLIFVSVGGLMQAHIHPPCPALDSDLTPTA